MRRYDLQVAAKVSVSFTVSDTLKTTPSPDGWNFVCLWKSKRGRGCWKGDKWNICQVYVNKSTMCPEVTSSSVSLNPCRRWGFKVVRRLSGSADRVLIRSHSASVQSQITRAQRDVEKREPCSCVQRELFQIELPLVYRSQPFLWLRDEACRNPLSSSPRFWISGNVTFTRACVHSKAVKQPVRD